MLAVNVKLELIVLAPELTLLAVNPPPGPPLTPLFSLNKTDKLLVGWPGTVQVRRFNDAPVLSTKQCMTYSSPGVKHVDWPSLQP